MSVTVFTVPVASALACLTVFAVVSDGTEPVASDAFLSYVSLYALLKLMSSNRLPSHALYPSTLRKAKRVTVAVAMYVPVYVSHWPVCAPSWNLLPAGISGLLTLVLMTVPTYPSLSPCPFAVVRVASCAVSLPGSPMMTLILSRWLESRLACLRLHLYMTPGTVATSW